MPRALLVLAFLVLVGCAGRQRPSIEETPTCSVCVVEIRNQSNVGLDIVLDDLANGPVIATLAPGGIRQVDVERRPRRLYGVYYRGMGRLVRGCGFTGMAGQVYRYTCR